MGKGGSLDKEEGRFEDLVRFIKEGKEQGFNFDYSFLSLKICLTLRRLRITGLSILSGR